MADGRPPTSPIPALAPTEAPTSAPATVLPQTTPPAGPVPILNWSHFKLEYTGTLEESSEAFLLRTNDWGDTYVFLDAVTIQGLCLSLIGEARL